MRPKWFVVFDWDGTIIDSLEIKINNAGTLFNKWFGVEEKKARDAYRKHSGIPRKRLFDAICKELSLPPLTDNVFNQMSKEFSSLNLQVISQIEVSEDTKHTLSALKSRDYYLFVSTAAAHDEVTFLVDKLNLAEFFVEVLGSKNGFTKGAAHISYILEKYGSPESGVIFIGDEPTDVRLGKEAGVLTAVRLGSHKREDLLAANPDYLLERLGDLLELLK